MDYCKRCGANLALVTRTHRCNPEAVAAVEAYRGKASVSETYRYRKDPDARRAYMRDYMRRRRAKT